jgi:Ca2+-binding RTX toxin-like protein
LFCVTRITASPSNLHYTPPYSNARSKEVPVAEFVSLIQLSALDGSTGFRLNGEARNDFAGTDVAGLGDINGDGFGDLIVGASGADANGIDTGASYVVFGKASGFGPALDLSALDGTNGFRLDGELDADHSGFAVSGAGDINGDGFGDFVIGAFGALSPRADGGTSYVVFGKASGFPSTLDLSALDGTNGFRIDGEAAFDQNGYAVSAAGDVNGDGFGDIIISAPQLGAAATGSPAGTSYVVFGKPAGFGSSFALSSLDGTNGFRILGEGPFDDSGSSLSSAGDVNGDGFADILIGAPYAYAGGNDSAAYVVFGKASGFGSLLELSSLDGANGFQITGETPDDLAGASVANAGDVNADGVADFIIGAPGADSSIGASYVVFGRAQGFGPNLNLANLNGRNGFKIVGEAADDESGFSVAAAGDVNGDGFGDIIIGARDASPNGDRSGAAYVLFGKASGFAAALPLSALNGGNGFKIAGADQFDFTGAAVSSGDINGDGFSDVIIGAAGLNPNGGAHVVFGHRADEAVTRIGTAIANTIAGGKGADTINGGGGNDTLSGFESDDTMNGGGDNDVMIGGSGNDLLSGITGDDRLNGGSGDDVLTGGAGRDLMAGATGADRFDFNAIAESGTTAAARDAIADFTQGVDVIDFGTIDAKAATAGNAAFTFIGAADFTAEGQIRAVQAGAHAILEINTAGTSGAEMTVQLSNFTATALTTADFIL